MISGAKVNCSLFVLLDNCRTQSYGRVGVHLCELCRESDILLNDHVGVCIRWHALPTSPKWRSKANKFKCTTKESLQVFWLASVCQLGLFVTQVKRYLLFIDQVTLARMTSPAATVLIQRGCIERMQLRLHSYEGRHGVLYCRRQRSGTQLEKRTHLKHV